MNPRPYVNESENERMVTALANKMPDDEWRYVRAFMIALEPEPLRQQAYIQKCYQEEIENA